MSFWDSDKGKDTEALKYELTWLKYEVELAMAVC